MKPHSLGTISIGPPQKTRAELEAEARAKARLATFKGQVMPETRVLACPKVKIADLPEGFIKQKWFERLEQNQKIASCCRHPENHSISAWKSHPDLEAPNNYVFHCTCGKNHPIFCAGLTDERPVWAA